MPLKYAAGMPQAVSTSAGPGGLFMLYLAAPLQLIGETDWGLRRSPPPSHRLGHPFGTFILDRQLKSDRTSPRPPLRLDHRSLRRAGPLGPPA
ncbi:MAG: DUF3817 domain-containing protein [Nannocystis sp.]|nr:DUF3817 domain-containing protein [Nannocystis sp.]